MKKFCLLLLSAILLTTSFSCKQNFTTPGNLPIKINAADVTSGALTLSDGGTTGAFRGDTITWSINAPNVRSFTISKKTFFDHDIFENPPGRTKAKTIKAKIKRSLWFNYKYNYSIVWTDTFNNQHTYDPLIYIRPRIK